MSHSSFSMLVDTNGQNDFPKLYATVAQAESGREVELVENDEISSLSGNYHLTSLSENLDLPERQHTLID